MSDFKFNFKSKDQKAMDLLKHLQINNSDKDYEERSADEYETLKSIMFEKKPNKIFDIGAGIGRTSVYFKNLAELDDTTFYLADFTGKEYEKKGGCGHHEDIDPIPYNDLKITKSFCENNGMNMKNIEIVDLAENEFEKIKDVDLISSFDSVGYHWLIEDAFKKYKLNAMASENAMLVFGGRMAIKKKEYPDVLGDFKIQEVIEGKFLQRFIIYKKGE